MIIFGVQNHKIYMEHKMCKTISGANVSVRAALPPVFIKTRRRGKRKGSVLDMKLRFAVSEKTFFNHVDGFNRVFFDVEIVIRKENIVLSASVLF
jgi:hypothetical protein